MRLIHLVGARPQFIKLAPLYKEIKKDGGEQSIIHTGQHYDEKMSKVFFDDLMIPKPDYNLGINQGTHAYQTADMMKAIEDILINTTNSMLIVYGDTNSTLAGTLVASKLHIPIIHIEAGLRSFNNTMPEEINRIITDRIADYLFAPTPTAVKHLKKEGLENKTFFTGDIMVDSIKQNISLAQESSTVLKDLNLKSEDYYLLTLHRPYNVDNASNLEKILTNLETLDKKVIFPIHPRTKKILENKLKLNLLNVRLIDPQGYLDFLILQQNALKVITDSGGIQKEACILKRPCITIRSETEWVETVEAGVNLLITNVEDNLADKIIDFKPTFTDKNIFGEMVGRKITNILGDLYAK
ncbi:MAG: UDP-N-acetylglucosamine 2-epimerase (non-hydrolyzing) [Candidatus Cloacimonetes bacterium 4572_65]|nr:MAG: UDP-N-acetylglucosamine 2-epimerase (non-hydrolyzing) [Candidatus Cloacimonetes bacterium 4572_65]